MINRSGNPGKIMVFKLLTTAKCFLYTLVFVGVIPKTPMSVLFIIVMAGILISGFWRSFYRYKNNKANILTLMLDLTLAVFFSLFSKSGRFDKLFIIYLAEGTAILPKPLVVAYGILDVIAVMGSTAFYNLREGGRLQFPGLAELLLYGFLFALIWSERRQREQRMVYEKLTKELKYVNLQLQESMALNESLASEAERRQLVGEIHDSLGYHLTGLLLTLEAGKKLMSRDEKAAKISWDKALELSRAAIHSIRELVAVKRESKFEFELTSHLRKMIQEVQSLTGLQIELDMNVQNMSLLGKAQFALYRIFQEALTNTLRHANASRAKIVIYDNREYLDFSYEDNGEGTNRIETGNGLRGMNRRILEIGGVIHFQSQLGMGFKIDGRIAEQRKDDD
jgi:signal transduction histidine kinase